MAKRVGGKTKKEWEAFKANVTKSEIESGKSPEKAEDIAYGAATNRGWRRGAFKSKRRK